MSCDRAANTRRWPGAEQLSRVRLRDRSVQVCTSPPGHPTAPQSPAHGLTSFKWLSDQLAVLSRC